MKKNLINIINEEIIKFDFLNNEKYIKEQNELDILRNHDFQKQFIVDSIINKRNKIKLDVVRADIYNNPDIIDSDVHYDMKVDYDADITYLYQDKKIPLTITIYGEKIEYYTDYSSEKQTRDYPGSFESWYTSIDWDSMDVNLYTPEGDLIDFVAFKKAPSTIKELFVRSYIESIIENKTDINNIKEKLPVYTSF